MNTRTTYTFNRQRNNQNGQSNLNKESNYISRTYENNQNDNGSVHSSYKYKRSNNESVNEGNYQKNENNQSNQNYNQKYQSYQNQNRMYQNQSNQNNENNNNNKSEFDLDKIDIQIENYKDKENNEDNNDILNALEQEGKFNDYAADNAYYDINNLLSNDLNKIDIEQDEKPIRNWFSDELINAQRTKIKNLIIELSKIDKKKELKEIMNEQNSLIKKYMEKQKEEFDAYFSKLKD